MKTSLTLPSPQEVVPIQGGRYFRIRNFAVAYPVTREFEQEEAAPFCTDNAIDGGPACSVVGVPGRPVQGLRSSARASELTPGY
jgi:hypothetical protein